MGKTAPSQLTISGVVHHGNPLVAGVGDVRVCPGANRTSFVDGYIFDGLQWRGLDLRSFSGAGRTFGAPEEIGTLMRNATSSVVRRKGLPVHYQRVGAGTRSKYVFRGVPLSHFRF